MLTLGWLNHPWFPGLLPDLRWRSYYWREKDIKQPDDRHVYSNSGNLWQEICWMIKHTDLSLMPENQDPMLIVATPSLSLDALNTIVKNFPPNLPHMLRNVTWGQVLKMQDCNTTLCSLGFGAETSIQPRDGHWKANKFWERKKTFADSFYRLQML